MQSRVQAGRRIRSLLRQTKDSGSLDKVRAGSTLTHHECIFVDSIKHSECLTNEGERQGMPR